jgi:hypothetical protein
MQSKTLNTILKSHPLAVLMVLSAVDQFTAEVAASSPADYPERGLVNPESWIALAADIQTQLKK